MTNSEVVTLIMQVYADAMHFLLPIIGTLAAIHLLITVIFRALFRRAGD